MSEHEDLLVKDELVVQNLKIPSNGTVTGLTISHIDGLSSAVGGNVDEQAILASLQEIDGFLATKPNSTDVYTKTQIDSTISGLATTATVNSQLQDKADSSTVYTQTQANTLLNAKADSADVYLKTEVDSAIAGFATTTELQNKAETSAVYDRGTIDTKLSDKANSSDVYLKTEVDSAISGFATTASVTSQLQNKAETSAVYDRGTIDTYLSDKANSADVYLKTEVDSSLALKVNSTELTTQLAQKASVSALNLKANITDLDSKADTTDLDAKADTTSVYTQSEITTLLAGKVDTDATLVQSENNEIIIPQRGIPYPPKNITIPSGNYPGGFASSTAWAPSWTISASDFTKVNGLRRKTYGTGSYALSNMMHENTSLPTPDRRFVELTLPYSVVATGVEAVQADELTVYNSYPEFDPISPNGWQTFAWDATNSTWVEMNMDNTRIFPDGSPGILPTTFREISGNTLSSNKYRVMVCEDEVATRFDGFRIYSKDESPPAIPLADVIESLIELNTFH
ncbi:unnamed protein product [Bathycoccus prasinos]